MKISHVVESSLVDGPGDRTVIFTQGCHFHCNGCQNARLWDPTGGANVDPVQLAADVAKVAVTGNVTISGGEPFNQSNDLLALVVALKENGIREIIVYTGYTWEQLNDRMSGKWIVVQAVLDVVDVVVDGPFIMSKDDDFISWRGSRNQRPIDVCQTRLTGQVVTLDWDGSLIIAASGNVFAPIGFASEFEVIGQTADTRRCGQTD